MTFENAPGSAAAYALALGNAISGGTVGKVLTIGAGNVLSETTITAYALAIGNAISGGTVGKVLVIGAGNILSETTITAYALAIGNAISGGAVGQYLKIGPGNVLSQGTPASSIAIGDAVGGSTTRRILFINSGVLADSDQLIFDNNNSVIIGGSANSNSGTGSAIVSGSGNNNSGVYSSICGGGSNSVSKNYASILGGLLNNINTLADFASIGGGQSNYISAQYGTIPGGVGNIVSAESATAVGRYANAYLWGQIARSSNQLVSVGDAQNSLIQSIRNSTGVTGATIEATLTGVAPAANNYILPLNNSSWFIACNWVAIVTAISGTATGISVGDAISGSDNFQSKRIAGVTTLSSITVVASKQMVTTPGQYVAATVAYSVGGSNQIKPILTFPTFAGGGSITVKFVCKMEVTEVYY